MLEATAAIATVLLVVREFLAQEPGERSQRGARLAAWGALPFLLAFAVLFTGRVLAYLGGG